MLKQAFFLLSLLCWLALPSALLSGQDSFTQRQADLTRLRSLLVKLRLQNRTQIEQYQTLLELSNSSTEQLTALKSDFDLNERELLFLRSVSERQGSSISVLSKEVEELTRISTRQSSLLTASLLKNKALTISVIVAVPVAFVLGLIIE